MSHLNVQAENTPKWQILVEGTVELFDAQACKLIIGDQNLKMIRFT